MASQATHTEPAGRPHTYDELMHPGAHHRASVTCPDPSAHKNSSNLQQQASSAALQASGSKRRNTAASMPISEILDKDNNLSSRSAAMSLKQARPEDLPSFPVVGVTTESSLGAALLADKNTKSFEHWKPGPSSNASKAAKLANDFKSSDVWKPGLSAAGSKAALIAAAQGPKLELWHPSASAEGNSAASQAMRKKGLAPEVDYGYTKDGRSRALMAATGAVSKNRVRSESMPMPVPDSYPDASNSSKNALRAALSANKPAQSSDSDRLEDEALEAARIRHIGANVSREMWTERPPIQLEVDEREHNAALRASAVSMAQTMMVTTQRLEAQHAAAAAAASSRANSISTTSAAPDLQTQARQYLQLQKAAYDLAQERLAKMDPDGAARYREHYGLDSQPTRSRLSIRGRPRRHASEGNIKAAAAANDSDSSDYDATNSRRIKRQMSQLNRKIQDTDAIKRQQDRASVLAAAEKKVHAQLHSMDERVFQETGKVSPALMEQWEAKARARAQHDSTIRMENVGKTYIGNGRYLDRAEIEAIAAAKLKPTLDEISETAARRRQYDENLELEKEAKERARLRNSANEDQTKIDIKRAKHESKMMAKQDKLQHKAAVKEEKLIAKQIKHQQKEAEKERKKSVKKEIYLEKREHSRSRSRQRNKVYGSAEANRSGPLPNLGSTNSLSEGRRSTDMASGHATAEDAPPVPAIDPAVVNAHQESAPAEDPAVAKRASDVSFSKGKHGHEEAHAQTTTSGSADPRSPVQQIGRLFHKLVPGRRSRATTIEEPDAEHSKVGQETTTEVPAVTAVIAAEPVVAVAATKEPVQHNDASPEMKGGESPSSFTRHAPQLDNLEADLTSSESEATDDEHPSRGRQGRRHHRKSATTEDAPEIDVPISSTGSFGDGLFQSTKALVTGEHAKNVLVVDHERPTTAASRTDDEEFMEARDTFGPPSDARSQTDRTREKTISPPRAAKFHEELA